MSAPHRAPNAASNAAPDPPDDRSTREVVRSVVANAQELVRKEVELAKLELREIVTARLVALALAVAAAMMTLFILAFAGVTVAKALEQVVAPWLAWLIVTGVYALVALLLLLVAYRLATRPPTRPERARTTFDDTVAWARTRLAGLAGKPERSDP